MCALPGSISALRRHASLIHFASQLIRPSCSCAAANALRVKLVVPAEPGSVTPYSHHVLIRLPPPPDQPPTSSTIWWPPIIEKHPALVQAFSGVAEAKPYVDGTVKVTAYEDTGPVTTADAVREQHADLMIYPAGVIYRCLPYDRIKEAVKHHVSDKIQEPRTPISLEAKRESAEGLAIFVCTHVSRDTRCGVVGREAAQKLQELVHQQGLDLVKVYQVSHVGGHKFAGNVLVYGSISPCDGDWFGGITKGNAAAFLEALINTQIGEDGGLESPQLRKWWRGRMALSREEQVGEYQRAAGIPSAQDQGDDSSTSGSESGLSTSDSSDEDTDTQYMPR